MNIWGIPKIYIYLLSPATGSSRCCPSQASPACAVQLKEPLIKEFWSMIACVTDQKIVKSLAVLWQESAGYIRNTSGNVWEKVSVILPRDNFTAQPWQRSLICATCWVTSEHQQYVKYWTFYCLLLLVLSHNPLKNMFVQDTALDLRLLNRDTEGENTDIMKLGRLSYLSLKWDRLGEHCTLWLLVG